MECYILWHLGCQSILNHVQYMLYLIKANSLFRLNNSTVNTMYGWISLTCDVESLSNGIISYIVFESIFAGKDIVIGWETKKYNWLLAMETNKESIIDRCWIKSYFDKHWFDKFVKIPTCFFCLLYAHEYF